MILFLILISTGFAGDLPCCLENQELSYLLYPKPYQKFRYLVQYEVFFSKILRKDKGVFIILPPGFHERPSERYPMLILLHGYNFERRGFWWKVRSPEKARRILCESKEEEFHWLLHEDIALIAYAMMDPKIQTYQGLEESLRKRFEELSAHGGLDKGDYAPREIAQSIVSHNLLDGMPLRGSFQSLQKMILILPDGDNGFYTDENEGRVLFPETRNRNSCDDFHPGEAWNYSLFPFLYMKPGALGQYESYLLELVQYIETRSPYRERILPVRGLGGFSMGGFGAIKMGLRYPQLFHSISSQSGLLDLDLFTNLWMLKMVLPEFIEIFGRLEPKGFPSSSTLDRSFIRSNNPVHMIRINGYQALPDRFYFDYGEKEGVEEIIHGNKNFEKVTNERSHQIPVQPFNGGAGHNYKFWRSRSGNILKHHSDILKRNIGLR